MIRRFEVRTRSPRDSRRRRGSPIMRNPSLSDAAVILALLLAGGLIGRFA